MDEKGKQIERQAWGRSKFNLQPSITCRQKLFAQQSADKIDKYFSKISLEYVPTGWMDGLDGSPEKTKQKALDHLRGRMKFNDHTMGRMESMDHFRDRMELKEQPWGRMKLKDQLMTLMDPMDQPSGRMELMDQSLTQSLT